MITKSWLKVSSRGDSYDHGKILWAKGKDPCVPPTKFPLLAKKIMKA